MIASNEQHVTVNFSAISVPRKVIKLDFLVKPQTTVKQFRTLLESMVGGLAPNHLYLVVNGTHLQDDQDLLTEFNTWKDPREPEIDVGIQLKVYTLGGGGGEYDYF